MQVNHKVSVALQARNAQAELCSIDFQPDITSVTLRLHFTLNMRSWMFSTNAEFFLEQLRSFAAKVERRNESAILYSLDESLTFAFNSNGNESYLKLSAEPLDLEPRDRLGFFDSGYRRLKYCDGMNEFARYFLPTQSNGSGLSDDNK